MDETVNPHTLKVLWSIHYQSLVDYGNSKISYNPACTTSVRVFIMLKLDTIQKKKKKKNAC